MNFKFVSSISEALAEAFKLEVSTSNLTDKDAIFKLFKEFDQKHAKAVDDLFGDIYSPDMILKLKSLFLKEIIGDDKKYMWIAMRTTEYAQFFNIKKEEERAKEFYNYKLIPYEEIRIEQVSEEYRKILHMLQFITDYDLGDDKDYDEHTTNMIKALMVYKYWMAIDEKDMGVIPTTNEETTAKFVEYVTQKLKSHYPNRDDVSKLAVTIASIDIDLMMMHMTNIIDQITESMNDN